VPNKYPALSGDGELMASSVGVYDTMSDVGAHEVFIESPRHVLSLAELPAKAVDEVVLAYRERMLARKQDERLECALIFKNVGESAGASLEHSHSQMICMPVVPKRVGEEMDRCIEFYRERGRCLLCEIVEQEIEQAERVVIDAEHFAVIAPYASRSPFEMWIVPKEHITHFENTPPELLAAFAPVLHEALSRLDVALNEPPYNYVIHTTPFTMPEVAHYHWHMEVIPRVTHVAGFEWGTGFYINPVMPQQAAQYLREAQVKEMAPRAPSPPEKPKEGAGRRRDSRRPRRR
jgi:UDPglucose--hexose-1-phosphate uridylyltransferase